MDISGVSASLVNDWITSQMGSDRDNAALFVSIAQMTDAQKASSLTTYLQNRASNDQTQINNLAAASQATQDALNADISSCNAAINTINGNK